MNVIKRMTPLRDVLYAFSLEKEIPDAELLDVFVRKYPEYAGELTDFAVEMIVDAASGNQSAVTDAVELRVSPAVSRAMSRFQNQLFEVRHSQAAVKKIVPAQASTVQNPFTALDRTGYRALVKALHANNLFVSRLRDREIDANTISEGFKRRIADELKAPLDLVTAHFSAQAQIDRRQFYKAEEKPEASRKTSFEDAIRNSGLTEEQQRYLLSL
jgi:hypothetical protein